MSGLSFGFTGSYIFSQTIFTYRTGVHTKWIGFLIMLVFMYIVASPVNILQVSPLFFLGSTLIFIGYDLMYEWLWEIRHQVFLSEYGIVWLTFCAIQVVGINDGILLGVLIAILEQVVLNAQTANINRVQRNSRAIWTPSDAKILHDHAYNPVGPKIITIEVIGTVFFGSSLHLLNRIIEEIGLDEDEKVLGSPAKGPHTPSFMLTHDQKPVKLPQIKQVKQGLPRPLGLRQRPPKYLVLDLMNVSNLDASATRGCFLQLVKMCAKRGIIVCASGLSPRMEWMFRSHGVSHKTLDDEEQFKAHLLSRNRNSPRGGRTKSVPVEVSLLFVTVQEALEFCETALIKDLNMSQRALSASQIDPAARSLPNILAHMLGTSTEIKEVLDRLEDGRYHEERDSKSGDFVFQMKSHSDAFYVVLQGCIANSTHTSYASNRQQESVFSGAGLVHSSGRLNSTDNLFDTASVDQQGQDVVKSVATLWRVGGIFGYLDFLLERPRTFRAVATQDGTRLARVTQSHLNLMQSEDPVLYGIMQRVLLHASTLDLRNCTCRDV
jgi:CRP-like cAMP-binding protein